MGRPGLAFIVERLFWLVLALLAPFAVVIHLPEVRAALLPIAAFWMPSEMDYLYGELKWGLATPAYLLFVIGVTVFGPIFWNRERTRGRGKLAEIKERSTPAPEMTPAPLGVARKRTTTSGCPRGGNSS